MAIKKLFLSYHSPHGEEVKRLAEELRLRGIVPWVDKDGGFAVADRSDREARRAIREDCFGLALYATPDVFDRPFIRNVEIDEVRRILDCGMPFDVFAIPRCTSFEELRQGSVAKFGIDLSRFYTRRMPEGCDDDMVVKEIACEVLKKVIRRHITVMGSTCLSLQFSTRELLPDAEEDALRIDAVGVAAGIPMGSAWARILLGLTDVKRCVSEVLGRPRIYVHGSKHLSTAFMFGRVFAPFCLDIRQTDRLVWSTDVGSLPGFEMDVMPQDTAVSSGHLFVELAALNKNVVPGVDAFIAASGMPQPVRLQLRPRHGPIPLDNALCVSMVAQAYAAIEQSVHDRLITDVHIFGAVPQAFMMMLGQKFQGMPRTHLYEWDGEAYQYCGFTPGGVI